jgi:dihydroorotase
VSTAGSVELLTAAKQRTTSLSAGISINNLALNENDVAPYRTFFKLSPPLRSEDDRQAMIEGLRSGAIDVIHSAHDPQDSEVKRQPFAEASEGAIGLETLLAAALRLVHSGDVPLMAVLRAMTQRPAEILGLAAGRLSIGAPADFILIDPDFPWVVAEKDIVSRSHNTAFEGARMQGAVMQSFVAGRSVFRHVEWPEGGK